MQESIIEDLKVIVKPYLEDSSLIENATVNSHLINEFNIDSLDVVDIIVDLEKKFSISIEDKLIEKITTLGDMVKIIESKLALVN